MLKDFLPSQRELLAQAERGLEVRGDGIKLLKKLYMTFFILGVSR